MRRIGLALSGGGFRATLFHLGMVRFLREANILPEVTHITSVSGGSVLAAHLVLNWHRYTDSLKEFDAAAAELIRFVQLDVRNRVVRRFPLAMPLRALGRVTFRRASPTEPDRPVGVPLREVPVWRHVFVSAARAAASAHSRHELERGLPVRLHARRVGHAAAAAGAAFPLRPDPCGADDVADGRHGLLGVSGVFPATRIARDRISGPTRPVRPGLVYRRRRVRQSGRADVQVPGAVVAGARSACNGTTWPTPSRWRGPGKCGPILGRQPTASLGGDDGPVAPRDGATGQFGQQIDRPGCSTSYGT